MSETVERTSLDLRYQTYRLRNDTAEARLLASIAERDIEQPLSGVDTPQGRLLLDGFKRYRCATKLGIECVPYVSLGEEEALGIASLMRAKQNTLSILEQARFVADLISPQMPRPWTIRRGVRSPWKAASSGSVPDASRMQATACQSCKSSRSICGPIAWAPDGCHPRFISV